MVVIMVGLSNVADPIHYIAILHGACKDQSGFITSMCVGQHLCARAGADEGHVFSIKPGHHVLVQAGQAELPAQVVQIVSQHPLQDQWQALVGDGCRVWRMSLYKQWRCVDQGKCRGSCIGAHRCRLTDLQ